MGAHKPNRVLTVHADPCLSALTESEPLVRTGAQVGCHCHNGSGFAPTVMLIFIARPFPGSWRMDVRGSQVCCPHRSCCTLMRCYSIFKFLKGVFSPFTCIRKETAILTTIYFSLFQKFVKVAQYTLLCFVNVLLSCVENRSTFSFGLVFIKQHFKKLPVTFR